MGVAQRGVVRFVLAGVVAGAVLATAACSDGGGAPTVPTGRAGVPGDTASPTGTSPAATSTAPPSTPPQEAADASSASASSASVAALDLPGCMVGTWTAPLGREFEHLALADRSAGTVRGGTGTLRLRFASDRRWTLTYEQVRLQLVAGSADVSGPVDGTWTLTGDTLGALVTGDRLSAKMSLGGVSTTSAPGMVTGALRTLTPTGATVTCTGGGLRLRLPTSEGGGTATFDAAG